MRKVLVIAASAALVAVLGLAIATLSGVFDSRTDVTFIGKIAGPQLLLPAADLKPADKKPVDKLAELKELRKLRTLDDNGGADDEIELTEGYTRVVHYFDVIHNLRSYERTYYPSEAGEKRGKLYRERIYAESGLGLKSETLMDRSGKLVRDGHLTEMVDGKSTSWQFDVSLYVDGLRNEGQVHNLSGQVIGRTNYRLNGTVETIFDYPSPSSTTYFHARHFALDGKTVTWEEWRAFGSYKIAFMYEGSNQVREISEVSPHEKKVTTFRLDGTKASEFSDWKGYGITVTECDLQGNIAFERFFKVDSGKGNVQGLEGYYLQRVTIGNGKEALVQYVWQDTKNFEVVELHKSATRKLRTDYRYDKNGKVKQRIEFGDDDKVSQIVNDPKDAPVTDIKSAWYVAPARPAVAASRVNVDGEVMSYHGGM